MVSGAFMAIRGQSVNARIIGAKVETNTDRISSLSHRANLKIVSVHWNASGALVDLVTIR